MQIYEQELTVTKDQLDLLNHVNNIEYVRWVQDIAAAHWTLKSTQEIRLKYFWVMMSHHIQYKGEALLGDTLLLKTFILHSKGAKSTRAVEIFNKTTGKLLTTSETVWCFMSSDTNKPARIPEDVANLFS
ncbi:acyl-CoA thioesterase [Psychroserpens burtonensis]|uniref:Acyl-CoA thioesterase n=1 Tax=Psychroserpens burtonensis TaxID=49278 RepID=A0A5C7B6N1_9FLAO|nr:thioesterase family protein [Psychroserpens burtonensis]TXE17494.1 acyl-CoA thioesterase [Psychroserpens burtonensis]